MNILTLENINKSYVEKILLNNVTMGIDEADKIGIIGINGTGKSTLLKIIAGVEEPDSGKRTEKSGLRIEYMPQNPMFDLDRTVMDEVFRGESVELKTIRKYRELLEKQDVSDEKMMKILSEMDEYRCWTLESDAKAILTVLGINEFDKKVGELSGGQRKRVALASALINPADLLILDEPTNHLDSDTISWLEDYIKEKRLALVMITHDRYFLDKVANRIIELDSGDIHEYKGNYVDFVAAKMEREEIEQSIQRKQERLLKKELAWMRSGVKARTTKQRARINRFKVLQETVSSVESGNEGLDISVNKTRLGNKIIEAHNLEKSYGDRKLIKDFSYTAVKGDRIGIVGKNGAGKSTLLKILSGREKIDGGDIEFGETVNIGVFSQETYEMNEDLRIIEYIREGAEYAKNKEGYKLSASQMLENFLFPPHVQGTYISKLSGGEKRRLYLLRVLLEGPNVLFLDEPTNDLDIETLTILEDYLDSFEGVIITVSHDRYFLDRVVDRIFSFENGEILDYPGNYTDFMIKYQQKSQDIEEKDKKQAKEASESQKSSRRLKDDRPKFTFKEQKEFENIDNDIEETENKLEEISEKMNKFATDMYKLQELQAEMEENEEKLEYLMKRWVYLNEIAEKIEEYKRNR